MPMTDWLEIAKNLPCGSKVKVHCCGNSDSMLVSHSEKGYSCHCFRCDDPAAHDFKPHGQRSIADIERHKRELKEAKGKPPFLPSDFSIEIPVKYAWFLKYGISLQTAMLWGFGWSEFFNRVVIPICGMYTNKLDAVHLRAVHEGDKPKFLNLGRPSPDAAFYALHGSRNRIVVVEDVISAIKVHMAGHCAVSINGSDITDTQVQRILSLSHDVYIWFDHDVAGWKGAEDAVKQFKMQGAKVQRVKSLADPKTYNKESINALMRGSIKC